MEAGGSAITALLRQWLHMPWKFVRSRLARSARTNPANRSVPTIIPTTREGITETSTRTWALGNAPTL
jgi:hypothetical protein